MGYLIGLDEAGYGPNLGPLVIAATVWQVPGEPQCHGNLYDHLSAVVCRHEKSSKTARAADDTGADRLTIADSKLLYNPQTGLKNLERGVLSMLRVAGLQPEDWHDLWDAIAPAIAQDRHAVPWHDGFNLRIPLAASAQDIRQAAVHLVAGMKAARIRLVAVRAVAIWPARFNALTDEYGSKGAALSRQTIQLLADALAPCTEAALVYGDKHGGRNLYGQFLQEQFPDHLVEIHGEGPLESIYRFGPANRRREVRFRVRGEELLPVALASMVAKYLRELSMRAFNEFWCERVPNLRATAGYPGDARRFKADIAATQARLGIEDHVLWRAR